MAGEPPNPRRFAPPSTVRSPNPRVRVPCPACGSEAFAPFHIERGWRYVRCRRCRTVYLSPRPTTRDVLDHYEDYLPDAPARIRAWEKAQRPLVVRASRLLAGRLESGARVLDVGCGYGFLAAECARCGLRASGVEISPTGIDHARSLGVDVRIGTLETVRLDEASFAAVSAFYLIEHLDDPASFFREARRVLRRGGLLLLRWPQSAPLVRWCRLLGIRIDLFDAPSHLTDFTPESLYGLLRETGFEVVRTRPGGSSRPPQWIPRIAGVLGAAVGDVLSAASLGRFIAPGASKTTLARAV